jgi:hypothetical protein
LYVIGLRLEPSPPKRAQDVGFYPTFLNTTGATLTYRWLVYIWKRDNLKHSFGETPSNVTSVPVGAQEQKAAGVWKPGVGGCEDFLARVAWLDENKQPVPFKQPDGQVFDLWFTVCP